MATPEEIHDEHRRVRHVQFIVGMTAQIIMQASLQRSEGEALVQAARGRILRLFPRGEQTYEILYARRFTRLLDEFTRPDPEPPGARVIPFRRQPRAGR